MKPQQAAYGYHSIDGKRVQLGTVSAEEYDVKKRQIDYANKIDSRSRWFIDDLTPPREGV